MRIPLLSTIIASLVLAGGPAAAEAIDQLPTGTVLMDDSAADAASLQFVDDPDPERVRTIMFIYVPPDYFGDNAEHFADIGIEGAMFGKIMRDWDVDIWRVPAKYAPGAESADGRIVGYENPVFQKCRRMNEQSRAAGVTFNSIKTALRHPLPDWFDDEGWGTLLENYRQLAVFARDAGFAGVTLDIEYINQTYELGYEAWQQPGYPRAQMREKARERGYQMLATMLDEFPDMIHWHLPQTTLVYGPLATDLVVGMISAMAERDSPGGFHMCTEGTYLETDPRSVVDHCRMVEQSVVRALEEHTDTQTLDYWRERCTINPGLWPLGVSRTIYDAAGVKLGHGGSYEKSSDRLVGSRADKSDNYSVAEFRGQYGAARMVSRRYIWIYGHNSVFWRMTPEELARYEGSQERDALPLDDEVEGYMDVIRADRIIDDDALREYAESVRNGEHPQFPGFSSEWWHVGPFPNGPGEFPVAYGPEQEIDLDARYPAIGEFEGVGDVVAWRRTDAVSDGYVDLIANIGDYDACTAYSVAWVECDRPTAAVFRVGTNDYGAVFVNGEEVYMNVREHTAVMDAEAFVVHLPAGRSSVMVKTGNTGGNWGFYLRITDAAGRNVDGLRWVVPEE